MRGERERSGYGCAMLATAVTMLKSRFAGEGLSLARSFRPAANSAD